jgi:diguanylate cyclase (GGDEF)-like protein
MQMKEAPRDEVACEATVLHKGSAIQKGVGLLLIDRNTKSIFAANQKLSVAYDQPQSLQDVFLKADAETISDDIQANKQSEPCFLRLKQGEYVWVSFFDAEAFVGVDITYIAEDANRSDDISLVFANCVQGMSREHEALMQSGGLDPKNYFDLLVHGVQKLSGFDRVMLYQFDPDLNGEVLAEARSAVEIPSFLGLKFPSGDIPKPARDLFLKNKVRQIVEVEALPEPVVSTYGEQGPIVFNQANSAFRYTSPIHLDYLTNMGVSATLTIGIVVRNKLWGLLSCHGTSGRRQMSPDKLTLCHVMSDLASNHVARLVEKQRTHASKMTREVLSRISKTVPTVETPDEFSDLVSSFQNDFLDLLNADGLQFESETTNLIIGTIPSGQSVREIDQMAKAWQRDYDRNFVATADLQRLGTDLSDETKGFPGLLHFASWDAKARLKIFRKAAVQSETWAGDPNAKERYADTSREVMHPRNSFTAYQDNTSGCSLVWEEAEIQVARELLSGLRNIEMTFHKSLAERQLRQSNAEMRQALSHANYEAHHDELTGVQNRRGFERMLAGMSPRAKRGNTMWLCHIDVDHFKKVNDTFGHLAGDAILMHVAAALSQSAADLGTVARIGGDEFSIVLSGGLQRKQINLLCEDFSKFLREPVFYNGLEISVTCTLGITTFEAGTEPSSAILKRSDLALYSGKAKGRGTFSFFSTEMEDESKARRCLEQEIERAIEADEFIPYFQPQIDIVSQEIVGCEMLSRWNHPQKGVLAPDTFLAVAEAMGVLGDIDRAMFRKAVVVQAEWKKKTTKIMPISVNVSFDRLRGNELIADLLELGESAQNFTLELLETIDLDESTIDYDGILKTLRTTGVGIELDDFGSGRSSILAVLLVQPDRLKIDKRLIDPIVADRSARNVVKSVIEIGEQLGIKSIAEGVETSGQADILLDLACERIQGYLYGKPQPAIHLEKSMSLATA